MWRRGWDGRAWSWTNFAAPPGAHLTNGLGALNDARRYSGTTYLAAYASAYNQVYELRLADGHASMWQWMYETPPLYTEAAGALTWTASVAEKPRPTVFTLDPADSTDSYPLIMGTAVGDKWKKENVPDTIAFAIGNWHSSTAVSAVWDPATGAEALYTFYWSPPPYSLKVAWMQ